MKSLTENLVVICNEILDVPGSVSINSSNRMNYWFIEVVLFSIAQFLTLMNII